MTIIDTDRTMHLLSQESGDFLGCFEWDLDNPRHVNFWDVDGNVDAHSFFRSTGDDLYREIIDWAASELGMDREDVYLTDGDETEILYAF